jgi:hypothetical protein
MEPSSTEAGDSTMTTTKAYRDGYRDGLAWDLDGYETTTALRSATTGWDEATINAMGSAACAKAWGVPREGTAWEAACRDYNRGAHAGALAVQSRRSGLPVQSPDPEPRRSRFSLCGQEGVAQKATSDGTVRYDPANPERESAIRALCARIERETGRDCYTVRRDSSNLRNGEVESVTYEITLTHAIPRRLGGGNSVDGSLWATVYLES